MTDIVSIGLGVDSREVDKGAKSLNKLGKQAKKTEKASDKMSKSFKIGMVAAMAAAAGAVVKTIQLHREFTKSISELSAITGATGKDLKFYREEALLLGSTTTFSASQVAKAFKLVASAKPELLESKEALAAVTREVLTLAEASGLDLPAAAKSLGGALNQFGAGAEEASRFINVLAAGAKFGSSEITETAEAMKNVGAVASSLGLSFESTNAAIQALASVSIKGAEAGTGLRGVLLKLANQSKSEFNPEIVGLEAALQNLKAANLSTTEKMSLFGLESTTAATALIAQADSVGVLTEKLTGTQTAMEQARINTDNLDGDIKSMSSSWEGASLTLGNVFNPALRASTQALTFIGKIITGIIISIEDMGNSIGAYAAASAAFLSGEFSMANDILELRKETNKENDKRLQQLFQEKELTESIDGGGEGTAAVEAETGKLALKVERETEAAEAKKEAQATTFADEFFAAQEHNEMMIDLEIEKKDKAILIAKQESDAKKAVMDGMFGNLISLMNSGSKKMFNVGKVAAIASGLVSMYESVTSSYAAGAKIGGPITGVAYAATAALAQAANLAKIKSASFGGGGGAATVSSTTGGNPVTGQLNLSPPSQQQEQAPSVKELRVVVESDGVHSEGMRKLAQDLAETIEDMGGVKTLVVS